MRRDLLLLLFGAALVLAAIEVLVLSGSLDRWIENHSRLYLFGV